MFQLFGANLQHKLPTYLDIFRNIAASFNQSQRSCFDKKCQISFPDTGKGSGHSWPIGVFPQNCRFRTPFNFCLCISFKLSPALTLSAHLYVLQHKLQHISVAKDLSYNNDCPLYNNSSPLKALASVKVSRRR